MVRVSKFLAAALLLASSFTAIGPAQAAATPPGTECHWVKVVVDTQPTLTPDGRWVYRPIYEYRWVCSYPILSYFF